MDILSSTPPDEVIAVGAALQAGLLVSRDSPELEQESTTVEVSASDILVKVEFYVQNASQCFVFCAFLCCRIKLSWTLVLLSL